MNTDTRSTLFLSKGGEMGQLIRAKDWSNTPVGPIENWSQSLLTILGIILNSKFPKFLWWGPELICFYNDAYRPSLGQHGKHPSILGMPAQEAWSEIWSLIKPLIDQVLHGGEATWSEDQLIPIYRNGKLEDVYWTFSYSPVHNESGHIAGVLVTCFETTEKVTVVKKLEESKSELEFAIEAAELGTFDYNPVTKSFSANKRLKEWLGVPLNASVNLPQVLNAVAEKDRARVEKAMQESMQFSSGGKYDVQYTIVHPSSKKEIIVHAKGKAWFDNNQVAYRLNGTLQDITEQMLFQQRLENQVMDRTRELDEHILDLARMNKELQSFAYVSSHDLQEPLRKIQTFASRIVEKEYKNLSDSGKDYFDRMQKSARRMQLLIDDLLAYSRTQTTQQNFEKINLSDIIEEVIQDMNEEIQQKQAVVETTGTCILHIVSFQFRQVFYNLIGNSLKFAKANQPAHIAIRCERVNELKLPHKNLLEETPYCHIQVADNGIGFQEEYKDRIFELFQRLHGKSEYEGTGIGLAIVKKIVENHNGIVLASSEAGKGATFDIYIPAISPPNL